MLATLEPISARLTIVAGGQPPIVEFTVGMAWVGRLSDVVRPRSQLVGWAIAAALLAVSIGLRVLFSPWLAQLPLLTFLPAIFLAALLGGWRQGVVVLLLSTLAADLYFLPTAAGDGRRLVSLLSFLAVGTLIVVFVAALVELVQRLQQAQRVHLTLSRELQHRVANNMQFVASMLSLARRAVSDVSAAEVLDQAASRIYAMGRLNRRLSDPAAYQEGLQDVLREVLDEVFHDIPVNVHLDVRARVLPVDHMTAIALLVSEAATNAAKHVFRPEQGSLFEVCLSEIPNGRLQLLVRDDGPGLAEMPAPSGAAQKLGMRIMQALAGQLGGSLRFERGAGTTLLVDFMPG